jgi:ABC-type sugar transport system substrate-binding protein
MRPDQARNQPIHRRKNIMSALLNRKPVLWFLFLFNAAIAIAAGGSSLHLHGSQQLITAAGMGMVALGAGAGLLRHRPNQT